jgi:hypothetical protein
MDRPVGLVYTLTTRTSAVRPKSLKTGRYSVLAQQLHTTRAAGGRSVPALNK